MVAPGAVSAIEPELVRPFTRAEYEQMIEAGLFQDERVELLRGVLVRMSPQLAPHSSTIQMLTELLVMRLQGRFRTRVQLPLALSADSEPEPDLAVVDLGDYHREHPRTARLVIEVSDTTLKRDRAKASLYASAGIAEYWIVNLSARTVEVYSAPDGDRYAEVRTLRDGETLRPAQLALELALAELLPKSEAQP